MLGIRPGICDYTAVEKSKWEEGTRLTARTRKSHREKSLSLSRTEAGRGEFG